MLDNTYSVALPVLRVIRLVRMPCMPLLMIMFAMLAQPFDVCFVGNAYETVLELMSTQFMSLYITRKNSFLMKRRKYYYFLCSILRREYVYKKMLFGSQ